MKDLVFAMVFLALLLLGCYSISRATPESLFRDSDRVEIVGIKGPENVHDQWWRLSVLDPKSGSISFRFVRNPSLIDDCHRSERCWAEKSADGRPTIHLHDFAQIQ